MNESDSYYVEKTAFLSNLAHQDELAFRESEDHILVEFGSEANWLRCLTQEFPKFIPFLTRQCGIRFHGSILEIGAGPCWFSAELSKIPDVTEITAMDFSPRLLKEMAPRVFQLLGALGHKITRMPGDFHRLEFPDNRFNFVVASAVLHHAVNMAQLLKETRRVLVPGGQFIAIREQIWPLVKFTSRSQTQARLLSAGVNEHYYTLAEYRQFFVDADFEFEAIPVNLASGSKRLWNHLVNGLTHARYAFLATKPLPR